MKKIFLLFIIVLALGCTNNTITYRGLNVNVQADPAKLFSGGTTRLFVDVQNNDVKNYRNVATDVFDAGIIDVKSCNRKGLDIMKPNQSYTIKCDLTGPPIEKSSVAQASVKTSFITDLNFIQSYQMVTQNAYKRESAAGSLRFAPKTYSYRDNYVEADVEFADDLPVVVRDKENYMYIKILNLGPGTLKLLGVNPNSNNIQCSKPILDTVGKEFPRVVCTLSKTVNDLSNFDELITVEYYYELINTAQIEVVK